MIELENFNFKKLNYKLLAVYYNFKKTKEFIDLDLMNLLLAIITKKIWSQI